MTPDPRQFPPARPSYPGLNSARIHWFLRGTKLAGVLHNLLRQGNPHDEAAQLAAPALLTSKAADGGLSLARLAILRDWMLEHPGHPVARAFNWGRLPEKLALDWQVYNSAHLAVDDPYAAQLVAPVPDTHMGQRLRPWQWANLLHNRATYLQTFATERQGFLPALAHEVGAGEGEVSESIARLNRHLQRYHLLGLFGSGRDGAAGTGHRPQLRAHWLGSELQHPHPERFARTKLMALLARRRARTQAKAAAPEAVVRHARGGGKLAKLKALLAKRRDHYKGQGIDPYFNHADGRVHLSVGDWGEDYERLVADCERLFGKAKVTTEAEAGPGKDPGWERVRYARAGPRRFARADGEAFLRGIQADPSDHARRLGYADWLQDQGNPLHHVVRASVLHEQGTHPAGQTGDFHFQGHVMLGAVPEPVPTYLNLEHAFRNHDGAVFPLLQITQYTGNPFGLGDPVQFNGIVGQAQLEEINNWLRGQNGHRSPGSRGSLASELIATGRRRYPAAESLPPDFANHLRRGEAPARLALARPAANTSLAAALAVLRSRQQVLRRGLAQRALEASGLTQARVIDALHDAAGVVRPAVLQQILGDAPAEQAAAAAAWYGLQAKQPGALVFTAHPEGPDRLYSFRLHGSGDQVQRALDAAGIGQRVLIPHAGKPAGFTVVLHDPGGRTYRQAVGALALQARTPVSEYAGFGRAVAGADAAGSRQAFRQTIRRAGAATMPGSPAPSPARNARMTPERKAMPHREHVEALAAKYGEAAARADHVAPFHSLPFDLQSAFLQHAGFEQPPVSDFFGETRAHAVRVNDRGWWGLRMSGNPVIAERELKEDFPHAGATGPSWLDLRPVRRHELDLFDTQTRAALEKIIAEDLAKPWGVQLYGRPDDQVIWAFATPDEAAHALRVGLGGAFARTGKIARRQIDR